MKDLLFNTLFPISTYCLEVPLISDIYPNFITWNHCKKAIHSLHAAQNKSKCTIETHFSHSIFLSTYFFLCKNPLWNNDSSGGETSSIDSSELRNQDTVAERFQIPWTRKIACSFVDCAQCDMALLVCNGDVDESTPARDSPPHATRDERCVAVRLEYSANALLTHACREGKGECVPRSIVPRCWTHSQRVELAFFSVALKNAQFHVVDDFLQALLKRHRMFRKPTVKK